MRHFYGNIKHLRPIAVRENTFSALYIGIDNFILQKEVGMAKVYSALAKKKDIVSAYGFRVEPETWQIYSDSETLSRILALYHESDIEVTPAFADSMDHESYSICDIYMLEAHCGQEDIELANHWLLQRTNYKVDVTIFECFPDEVSHLLEQFRD